MISHDINMIPAREPPARAVGVLAWVKNNLFANPLSALTTLLIAYGLYLLVPPLVQWAFMEATWFGTDSTACSSEGACWAFITARLDQFIYGFYPEEQQWRADLFFAQLAILITWLSFKVTPGKSGCWAIAWY